MKYRYLKIPLTYSNEVFVLCYITTLIIINGAHYVHSSRVTVHSMLIFLLIVFIIFLENYYFILSYLFPSVLLCYLWISPRGIDKGTSYRIFHNFYRWLWNWYSKKLYIEWQMIQYWCPFSGVDLCVGKRSHPFIN